MSVSPGRVAACVGAALAAHLVAAIAIHRLPLFGTGAFAESVAAATGRPEFAGGGRPEPLRVTLGGAERALFEGPGPVARLDPLAVRRPPVLGPGRSDLEIRIAPALQLVAVSPAETSRPMERRPPGTAALSWADGEMSLLALEVAPHAAVRRLGAGPLAPAALSALAERGRTALSPRAEAARLRIEPANLAEALAPDWPEPTRAFRVPEVYVDPLEGIDAPRGR